MGSRHGVLEVAAQRIGLSAADYTARVIIDEKWCVGCKRWHLIDDFGQDASRPDGRASICRADRRRRGRASYAARRAAWNAKGWADR